MKLWLLETRAPFLSASVVPILLGSAIAWWHMQASGVGMFHWGYFLLTLVAGICIHTGTNVVNDYFDHKSRCDDINVEYVSPFTGGSRLIQMGLLTPRAVLIEGLIFFAIGSAIGLYLVWARGLTILVLGIIGVFCGFFYTAPPFKLASRGIGELAIGVNFGMLMTLGAYWVQTQSFAWPPALAAIPVSILIATLVYINQFQDCAADKAAGKTHLVVRLGKERAAKGYVVLMVSVNLAVVIGVILGVVPGVGLPLLALLGLLTLPLALRAVRTALAHYADSIELAPANAATIKTHLLTGLLLCGGFLLDGLRLALF